MRRLCRRAGCHLRSCRRPSPAPEREAHEPRLSPAAVHPTPGDGGRVPSYSTIALAREQWETIRATATEDYNASAHSGDRGIYLKIVGVADHALEDDTTATPAVLVGGTLRTGGYYAAGPGARRARMSAGAYRCPWLSRRRLRQVGQRGLAPWP